MKELPEDGFGDGPDDASEDWMVYLCLLSHCNQGIKLSLKQTCINVACG